jgi:hypothetical protein
MATQQSSSVVLTVQPRSFGFDVQTARTNTFQNSPQLSESNVRLRANSEFTQAVAVLRQHGITVEVYQPQDTLDKPNAVFPNNWVTTWPDGSVYIYPMATKSRRVERDMAVFTMLSQSYDIRRVMDISASEANARYLEGTGVMVFDHDNKVAYGCLSVRCDESLFREHARTLGYKPITFHAYDTNGVAIYHTNVMMGIQSRTAVVCSSIIRDETERTRLLATLQKTHRDIVEISEEQMIAFCGNVLELRNGQGDYFLALSQSAYDHFTPRQREVLSQDKTLLPLAIPTIESVGGGSVRCMLAEVFLPARNRSVV